MKRINTLILSILAFAQGAIITYTQFYLKEGVSLDVFVEKTEVLRWLVFLGLIFLIIVNFVEQAKRFLKKRIVKIDKGNS